MIGLLFFDMFFDVFISLWNDSRSVFIILESFQLSRYNMSLLITISYQILSTRLSMMKIVL